ncbi:MAG: dockerin type I repeat-containing protein [Phycisphaerales bacterium]
MSSPSFPSPLASLAPRRALRAAITLLSALLPATVAAGGVVVFADNPEGNSLDMAAWVSGQCRCAVDGTVDFESHPEGELVADFYPGVLLEGFNVLVTHGPGSLEGTDAPPQSPGEGPLGPYQGYTANGSTADGWSLTASFAAPVLAAGFFTADVFDGFGDNGLLVEAFDDVSGGGTLLGSTMTAAWNFELNARYFVGLGDPLGRIRSIRISIPTVLYGDSQYVDGILFAAPPRVAPCMGDLDGSGDVNGADLGLLLASWNGAAADLDGDGVVNGADLGILLAAWGPCP